MRILHFVFLFINLTFLNDLFAQDVSVDWVSLSDSTSVVIQKVVVDSEDNVIVLGYFKEISIQGHELSSTDPSDFNVFLGKWNHQGTLLWVTSIGGTECKGHSVTVDSDDNIIVSAYFHYHISVNGEFFEAKKTVDELIIKYDKDGYISWVKRINFFNSWGALPVRTDSEDNIYFLTNGTTETDGDTTEGQAVLTKLDEDGHLLWAKSMDIEFGLGGTVVDIPMQINSKDEIIVYGNMIKDITFAGSEYVMHRELPDIIIAKFDADGNEVGAAKCDATWMFTPVTVTLNQEDDIYISGYYYDSLSFGDNLLTVDYPSQGFLAKLNNNLEFEAAQNITGPEIDGAMTNSAGTYLTGHRDLKMFIERYDENCLLEESIELGEGNVNIEYGRSIGTFSDNKIVIGGTYFSPFSIGHIELPGNDWYEYDDRMVLFKLGCGLTEYNSDCIRTFEYGIFPNPTLDHLTINFDKGFNLRELLVYDLSGKLIVHNEGYQDQLSIDLDVAQLSAGVYLIRLIGENNQEIVDRFVKL